MRYRLMPVLALLAIGLPTLAQKQEIKELQRDVAIMQNDFRALQRSVEEKLSALQTLVQAALDEGGKANRAITVLDSTMRARMGEQQKSLVAPLATVGTKVDSMSEDFRRVRETVDELNSRVGRLQQKLGDIDNAIKIMQAPPAAPAPAPGTPPPGVTAEGLYQDALRDKQAGNADLSMQEFRDYLKYFPSSEFAANAQYYIGELHYNAKRYDEALTAFDEVLAKYPRNAKTADALFMKGRTLLRLNRRNDGADAFRELIKEAPGSELASKAQAELRSLGVSAPRSTRKK